MTRSELFDKIIQLIRQKFTGIVKIKFEKGRIVWAKAPRDL